MNESILDSDLDIIIKAGAGCGKTKILVDRYLAELRKESDGLYVGVDRLAAITFTEKAAEELQSRLRDKITEEIEKLSATFLDSSSNSLIGSSANLEASISATNQEHGLLLNLIRQRQGLASGYISTIHSFCARILKENSIAARVNPDFTIIDPISAYKLRHDAIKELILKRLLANDSIIKSWVANCGFEKPTGLISQIAKIAAIIRLSNQDSQSIHKSYAAIVEKLAASSDCSKVNIDSMIDSLRFINEDNKRIKIQYAEELLKLKEPLLAGLELDKIGDAIGLVSKLQSHIKRHEEKLSTDDIDKIKSAIKIIRTSVDKRIEVDTSNSFKAIVSLIFDAEKLYQFKKSVTGELDYDDLEIFTLNLIKHNNEIRDALQKKFVKIMVDEFQDTNDLQNELISYLAPFGSGKLFVVGDRKQAIYQFRGSNVELFDSIAKEASISSNSLFYLNRNYRSNEQIINFCNLLVKDISKGDRNENELDLLTPASPASEGKSNGEIRIVQGPLDATTVDKVREQEANYIVKLIDDAVTNHTMTVYDKTISSNRAVRYSDFGILFRAFSDINIYERAFKRAAIPYELFGGGEFFNAPEVVDFLNLLTFIENRYDKLAFLATLRSPFVALSDQTLLELTIASDGTLIDHDSYLTKEKEPLITDKSELVEFNRFIDLYLRWEELAGRLLLSELMEEVLRESGYNSILLGNEFGFRQLANIHKLIEKGRKFETGSILTLSEFLDDCNLAKQSEKETSANIYKSDNMVSILTVHSAKGLEFPIIILANIAAKAPTYSAPINFSSRSGLGVKWFNQLTDSWLEPYSYRLIKDEQKSASDDEELRVLYVAMTRACDHLIILLPDHLRHKSAWVKQIAVLAKKGSDIITQDSYSS
ncbi:MAG: UvrD-helicase domain-containing protein, partial [Nitrospinota bacterium]